jgi:hypothetical protein
MTNSRKSTPCYGVAKLGIPSNAREEVASTEDLNVTYMV